MSHTNIIQSNYYDIKIAQNNKCRNILRKTKKKLINVVEYYIKFRNGDIKK